MSDESNHGRRFREEAARRYRAAAEELDPGTRSALARARADALARGRAGARRWRPAVAVAATAAAAAALVLAVSPMRPPATELPPPEVIAAGDLELLLGEEELDLFAELDFYLWLETEPDVG